MSYSVDKQVAELKAWVGFREGPNNKNPFSLWHGYGTQFLPWCDSFAQFCAVEKGGFVWKSPYAQFGPKGSGYVPTTCRDAQHMGIWRTKNTRARPGWQVHFDWNGDGEQDHDETVIADDGTNLVTIGGNTSDAVLYRKRNRTYVAGFVALDEAGQNAVPIPPPVAVPPKGRIVDYTHTRMTLMDVAWKAPGYFESSWNTGVDLAPGACWATLHGPKYDTDGTWPWLAGATVRVQIREQQRVLVSVTAPNWKDGNPLPKAHVFGIPA